MKKLFTAGLVLLLVCSVCFAANSRKANNQKIYSVDTDIYKTISSIYVLTGRALPSATGPWSADELLSMLNSIERDSVPAYMLERYDAAAAELESGHDVVFGGGALDFSGTLDGELYAHTYNVQSTDISRTDINGLTDHAFEGRTWWFGKDLTKITPLFDFKMEAWLGSWFYGIFDFGLQNTMRGSEYGELGSTLFNTNIPTLQNFKFNFKLIDIAGFPDRAFASFGGKGWSVQVGRDRLSWGAGSTGNLTVSDNFQYHDMVRFTAYGEKFKYTYLISFFPSKENYYNGTSYTGTGNNNSTKTLNGLLFYSAHRFEWRLFRDKLNLILTEGLIYGSAANNFQFAAISPLYFMHNAFMPNNSNSTLALEFDWTPVRGLSVYGQVLLDQFTFPGIEDPVGPDKDYSSSPNGLAFLGGAKYMTGLKGGLLTINPEVVYVSPFCYLRDGYTGSYGLDYVAAVRTRMYAYEARDLGTDIFYDEYTVGYTYGPDCLAANVAASWEGQKLTLSAKGFFMIHGTHDLWTVWKKVPEHTSESVYNSQYAGLTSSHAATGNYRYPDAQGTRNALWYTFDIGVGASYRLLDNLELSLNVDFVKMNNIFNVSGQNAFDVHFILGVKYDCF